MTINRKLSPIEQSMEILNRRVAANVVTISRVQGKLSQDIVRQALDLIQVRHPLLNSRIVGNLDNICFEFGAEQLPLRIVHKKYLAQWQEVVLEELNQPIASNKYLARSVLIRFADENINYLLIILHHAISDGLSIVKLHSEILTYCQKLVSNQLDSDTFILSPLPSIQKLMPQSMQGKLGVIKGICFALRLLLKIILYQPKKLTFEQCVPFKLRTAGMIHRQLNREDTVKLVEICRNKNTTVQCALCAAMLIAVARKISNINKTNICLSCHSYVDLRKRFLPEVNRENLGILTSAITSFHTLDSKVSFWNLAQDVKKQLAASLQSEDIFSSVLVSKKIYDFLLLQPNKAPVSVAVTNIGRVTIPSDYGEFKLEEISFVPSQAVFGGTFSVAVATFQDTMLLNFTFSEPSVSRESAESLANDVMSYMLDACHETHL
ncbi:phthiocerol/phthiodiolone dimycocerosyl transferase family protein [Anabaena sp. UHCC 0399]|uniref:phthiocerol/phthiodiolone dimycocerosyl transferase family protein n=1 Tax=Anabaena sp. UHCC 0399 TaxID=3110238 RepID=UPI002B1F95EC|nr:alcohol acetyltransferase [Anabaena sp. UHCC 0399]MEA5567008.1 alcohol acetyltransferase [Anabaena sp. UHCC 0399]